MKKPISQQKSRGRPATGQTPMLGFRATDELRGKIVHWAEFQPDLPKLSEAVRRLVELGLTVKTKRRLTNENQKLRAREMAGKTIDHLTDAGAHAADQASRKRRLLKGPEEFRETRIDRPKRKPWFAIRGLVEADWEQEQMMPKKPLIYAVEVDGKPMLAFEDQAREAAELCKEAWFRADLCKVTSNGVPVCRASSIIKSRIACEGEMAIYREAGKEAEASNDILFAYLVELNGMPRWTGSAVTMRNCRTVKQSRA
jgi:hypothetical protein